MIEEYLYATDTLNLDEIMTKCWHTLRGVTAEAWMERLNQSMVDFQRCICAQHIQGGCSMAMLDEEKSR